MKPLRITRRHRMDDPHSANLGPITQRRGIFKTQGALLAPPRPMLALADRDHLSVPMNGDGRGPTRAGPDLHS